MGFEPSRSLLLHAEMKLPGVARLEFHIDPIDTGTSAKLTMTACFRPKGLLGLLYWYSVVPLHSIVFGGMLKGIKRAAESGQHPEKRPESSSPSDPVESSKSRVKAKPTGTLKGIC